MPAMRPQPKGAEVIFFGDSMAAATFELQPELRPAVATHRHPGLGGANQEAARCAFAHRWLLGVSLLPQHLRIGERWLDLVVKPFIEVHKPLKRRRDCFVGSFRVAIGYIEAVYVVRRIERSHHR